MELVNRVDSLEERVVRVEHRLVGVDGNNGLTSKVNALEALVGGVSVPALKRWGEDIWHNQRPESCIGKELLKTYKDEHERTHLTDVDMRKLAFDADKARRDSRTTLVVAVIGAVAAIAGRLLPG